MSRVVAFFLASVVAVAAAGSLLLAQIPLAQVQRIQPPIVSGNDIGFRVEGTEPRTGRPIGTLMLRMDGEWVEAGWSGGVRLIK
jgi:hypothetical protein